MKYKPIFLIWALYLHFGGMVGRRAAEALLLLASLITFINMKRRIVYLSGGMSFFLFTA